MLLLTEFSFSPRTHLISLRGSPKRLKSMRRSKTCSDQVRVDENSEPHQAVSALDCFFVCQCEGVLLNMQSTSMNNLPFMAP